VTLNGLRVESGPAREDPAHALASHGQVVYSVAPTPDNAAARREPDHRSSGRSRTRLRSAKIVNSSDIFLCECRIHDRSSGGLRLVLARCVALPGRFRLYEDESARTNWVGVVWRRGAEVGVLYGAPAPLKPSDRFALRERYYAVPDR
jgi:hypothetical protein